MTLPKTLEKYRPIIDDFGKHDDGTGYYIFVKPGLIQLDGVHDISESTVRECAYALATMQPCACAECVDMLKARKPAAPEAC